MKKKFAAIGETWFILKFVTSLLWKADSRSLLSAVSLNVLDGLAIVPNVYLDKLFLDTLINNIQTPNPYFAFNQILVIVALRLGVQLLQTLARRSSGYYARILNMRRNQLSEVMLGIKYSVIGVPVIEDPDFKDRYQKILNEGTAKLQQITENFLQTPRSISGMFAALSIFLVVSPWVILVSLLSLIPSFIVDRLFIKKGYDLDSKISKKHRIRGAYSGQLSRTRSYMELRLLNIHKYLGQKVTNIWEEIIFQRREFNKSSRTWGYLAGTVDDIVSYSLNAYFAFLAIVGRITIGSAQAFVRAIATFKTNATSLSSALLSLYECNLYISDLVWFLNLDEPYSKKTGQEFPENPISIKFDDVWFKYPGSDSWILKGVSFEIEPKQNVALVGKNGAGKTTLVKLLCGFYEPSKGQISIDGVPISSLDKENYWSRLSVLFQDFDGYSLSARESIAVGNIKKVDNTKAIQKYAKLSDIDSWISSLPKKYDNPISRDFEKGTSPSTGQWQRIAIARALFKDPEILVLDEPTSNVDPEAEEQIFHKILEVGKDKIIFFISHRFSTVRKADRIFVMQDGVITESGSHEQLMKQKGEYAKLFTLQAKSYK